MAKKSLRVKKMRRRMLLFGVSSIAIIVATTFTIGRYWVEIYDKYRENKALEKELVDLKDKEDQLRLDAKRLQNPEYIARYAREKYLYSKNGEYIIKMPEE